MHRWLFVLVMSTFLFSGCDNESSENRVLPLWALEMQAESRLLAQQQPVVRVENVVLGTRESFDTNFVAWESVYSIFLEAAVPEEAMQSGYVLQTLLSAQDSTLIWTAQKENRRPQLLALIYRREDASLKGVHIENRSDNMFYESAQSLHYAKGDSILIEGMNKLRWQSSKSYRQYLRF